jgi:hypothetical protein
MIHGANQPTKYAGRDSRQHARESESLRGQIRRKRREQGNGDFHRRIVQAPTQPHGRPTNHQSNEDAPESNDENVRAGLRK